MDEPASAEARTRRRWITRTRVSAFVLLLVMGLVYVAVLVLYARSTQADVPLAAVTDEQAADKMLVGLEFTGLSSSDTSMTLQMKVIPTETLVDEDGFLKKTLEILVLTVEPDPDLSSRALPIDGTSFTFESGVLVLTGEVKVRPSGQRQNYPFDEYSGYISVLAVVKEGDRRTEIPTLLVLGGDAPGWSVESEREEDLETDAVTLDTSLLKYEVSRAGSTVTIVVLILGAMIVMVLCAAWVSRSVLRKHRRIEATMASWFAALMFAVIPLRLNMPGAPAMGAWMDFAVVLWVEMGLMIALAIFIYSWLSYTPKPDYAPQEPEPEPEPKPVNDEATERGEA